MRPGVYNLDIYQGSDHQETFLFETLIDDEQTPFNFFGWSAQASFSIDDNVYDISLITIGPDYASGLITITIPRDVTKDLEPGSTGTWDLFLINPSNIAKPYLRGKVRIFDTDTEVE